MDLISVLKFIVLSLIVGTVVQRLLDKLQKRLPGPVGIPILGRLPWVIYNTIFHFRGNFFDAVVCDGQSYGDARLLRIGMREFVILSSIDSIREALVKQADDFIDRPTSVDYYSLHRLIEVSENGKQVKANGGILFSNDRVWKEHRRFALRVLRDAGLGKTATETNIRIEIEGLVDHLSSRSNKAFNPNQCLTRAVCNIICQLVFSIRVGYESPDFDRQIAIFKNFTQNFTLVEFLPLLFPFLENKYFYDFASMHQYIDWDEELLNYMSSKIEEVESNFNEEEQPSNYVEAYLSEYKRLEAAGTDTSLFTRKQLMVSVADLFLAGTDTTSTALNWAFIYMAMYKDWQQKVHEELDRVLDSRANVSYIDRLRCPVIQAVLDETMRHCPPLPHNGGKEIRKETWFRGCRISPNTYIIPDIKSAHYDRNVWSEPHKFDPSRFLNDKGDYQPSKKLITFSLGKRSCVGEGLARMEFFMFFTGLMLKFKVDMDEDTRRKGEDIFLGSDGAVHAPKEHQLIFNERFPE